MSIVVLTVLLLYFLIDYKKGTILILLLMPLLGIASLAGQGLNLWLGVVVFGKWILESKNKISAIRHSSFLWAILLMSFSYFISNHYAISPHLPSVISSVIQFFLIFVLSDYLIKFPNLKSYALKVIIIMAIVLSVNGTIETITRFNILLSFAKITGLYADSTPVITEIRYGLKRAQSAFAMHTSWGGYTFIVFCFLFYLKKFCNVNFRYSELLIILLGMNLFFTGTRSAFVGFILALLAFVNVKDLKSKKAWGVIFLILAISPFFLGYFDDIIASFVDTSKVHGSDSEMRQTQFDICFYYLARSPWIGNGIAFTWEHVLPQNEDLYGAESLWIPVLIDQGWLGALAVIFIFLSCILYLRKHNNLRYVFVVLGFLVFNSMSSIPNINLTDFVYYIILLCTFSGQIQLYKNERTIKRAA